MSKLKLSGKDTIFIKGHTYLIKELTFSAEWITGTFKYCQNGFNVFDTPLGAYGIEDKDCIDSLYDITDTTIMELRGKNTNNTLSELKSVLASIQSGKSNTDGYADALKDIQEDITQLEGHQLTLEQANLNNIHKYVSKTQQSAAYESFKAGAEWQKEQYKLILEALEFGQAYMKLYMKKMGQSIILEPEPGSALDKINKAIERLQD